MLLVLWPLNANALGTTLCKCTQRYIVERKRYTAIQQQLLNTRVMHQHIYIQLPIWTHSSIHLTGWPRNGIYTYAQHVTTYKYINTKYTTIITSHPLGILHAYITRYWTPRRHLHSIHETPPDTVLAEHRLVNTTHNIPQCVNII
jgi:hypothetical protein